MKETQLAPSLLITHTDRDGVFSGAALLRALGDPDRPDVVLTQGSYLADELEALVAEGRRYLSIFVCDTYWHPPHASRVVAALRSLLDPDRGVVSWFDHHPSSVAAEASMRRDLALGPRSRIEGDRQGRFEAVSLVASAFDARRDPVVAGLMAATARSWERRGEMAPANVASWLRVVDGLSRFPSLPSDRGAEIVRRLARGFDCPLPDDLRPLEQFSTRVERRTVELLAASWTRFPSVDGGEGLLLDLHDEPLANAYALALGLFRESGRRVDWFVVAEHPAQVHYVSSARARAARDVAEQGHPPGLRVSTMFKPSRRPGASWRARRGIDLHYLAIRKPAPGAIGSWIEAHPYLIKGLWRDGVVVDRTSIAEVAADVAAAMADVLGTFGWSDADRRGGS